MLAMQLDAETTAQLDQVVPPGGAFANFSNNSGWMKATLDPSG